MHIIFIKNTIIVFIVGVLVSCSSHSYIVKNHTYKANSINDGISVDSSSWKTIQPYKQKVDQEMSRIIGTCARMIYRDSATHELVGWMAEAIFYETQKIYPESLDFAIMGSGGVRIPMLAKGSITIGKIFELMPFENEIVVLTLNGSVIKELFNYIPTNYQSFNCTNTHLTYKNKTLTKAIIHGVAFDSTKTYKIVVSDYMALGGDNMFFLKKAIKKETLQLTLRNSLINYIESQAQQGKLIEPHNSGSITNE